jgi:hypothetical protein
MTVAKSCDRGKMDLEEYFPVEHNFRWHKMEHDEECVAMKANKATE